MKTYKVVNEKPNIVFIKDKVIDDYYRINPESYDISFLKKDETLQNNTLVSLEEITSFISHVTGFETEKYIRYVENGKGFIRIVNLEEFFINLQDIKKIPDESYNILSKYHLRAGDILLSKDGTIGRAAIVNDSLGEAIGSSHVVTIRIEEDKIDPHYVVAFINSAYGQFQCSKFSTGSIQKALNVEKIRKLQIPMPSPEIQKYIGDKVRKAEELREEAKRLKKEAELILTLNINFGSDIFGLHAGKLMVGSEDEKKSIFVNEKRINDRIDAKFYQPELIEIVKMIEKHGYVVLKDTLDFYDTGMSQLEYSNEGYSVISTGSIKNEYLGDVEKFTNKKIPENKLLDKNDVLMTTYGATSIGKIDIYTIKDDRTTFDYTLFRMKFKKEYLPYFMSCILRCIVVQKQIKYAINSGGGTNYINNDVILNLKIPKVDEGVMFEIDELINKANQCNLFSKQLILETKKDVEELIEGNFEMSKLNQS